VKNSYEIHPRPYEKSVVKKPDSLHRHVKEFSEQEGVSINQFISTAVAEKMSALSAQDHPKSRTGRGSLAKLKKLLQQLRAVEPEAGDRL